MRSINKNCVILLGLFLPLGILSFAALQKFLPLLSHVTYYCESFINSHSMPIPYYLGIIPFILFFAFLLVALVKLLIIYVKVQFFRKQLIHNNNRKTHVNYLIEKLHIKDKTYLVKNKRPFAFCLGIRDPKIYVSTGLIAILTSKEIEAVLLHERYHLKNRDTFTMLIASIGESLLPFFPLFSDVLRNFRIEKEIQADKTAIEGLGSSKSVISILRKLLTVPETHLAIAPAIADYDTLEPRILALVKKDFRFRKFKLHRVLISIFSVVLLSLISFSPVHAVEIHNMGQDEMIICPHDNGCMNACQKAYTTPKRNSSQDILYSPINSSAQ